MARVVVVGGGVIGCAIAYRLAQDGHHVTLVERDRVGAHASGAAAGLLSPYTADWPSPRMADLAAESLVLFPDLAARLEAESGLGIEFRATPSLAVARDAAAFERLGTLHRRLVAQGVTASLLDQEALAREEPGLSGELVGALLTVQAQVTPLRFVEALARGATAAGAEVLQSTAVLSLRAQDDRIHSVRTSAATLEAEWVVLAAGPWSPEVAATLGLDLRVEPRRGQLVALAPPKRVLAHLITQGSYYLVPKPDGTVVAGSTEEEQGFDARPTAAGVAGLLDRARSLAPALADAGVGRVWAGIRPHTPEGHPLIGPAPGFQNLVLATGHHRDGVLLAPITAELVAAGLKGTWAPVG